jgi:hypothetical protein
MVVTGKVCGVTSNDRYLAVLVDNFNFLGGDELSTSSLQSTPATPLSTKRDLWDRSDVDRISGTPSTKRRLPWDRKRRLEKLQVLEASNAEGYPRVDANLEARKFKIQCDCELCMPENGCVKVLRR